MNGIKYSSLTSAMTSSGGEDVRLTDVMLWKLPGKPILTNEPLVSKFDRLTSDAGPLCLHDLARCKAGSDGRLAL